MALRDLLGTALNLLSVAGAQGVRDDWHEPDEQDIEAIVVGNHLDNAHGNHVHPDTADFQEFVVRLYERQGGGDTTLLGDFNLASLLALATVGAQLLVDMEEAETDTHIKGRNPLTDQFGLLTPEV